MFSTQHIAIPLALVACAWGFASAGVPAHADPPIAMEPGEPTKVDLDDVADDDAVELDVLAVTSLPLAADQARAAGIDPAEVADVIGAVMDVGASPAVATDVLIAETEQAKKRGRRPHFAGWVRGQLAEGVHSKQLVEMIEKREAEYIEQSAAERHRLDAKIEAMRARMIEERKAQTLELDALAKDLAKRGKKLRMAGAEKLAKLRARAMKEVE
jgi:hypothetical protein